MTPGEAAAAPKSWRDELEGLVVGRHVLYQRALGARKDCAHVVDVGADGRVNLVYWTEHGTMVPVSNVEYEKSPMVNATQARWCWMEHQKQQQAKA